MVLYSTEISKLIAKKLPVTDVIETEKPVEKPKRVRKPKIVKTVEEASPKVECEPVEPVEEEVETLVSTPVPSVTKKKRTKKPLSEKQLENLRLGQEKRKLALKNNQKKSIKAIEHQITKVKTEIKKRNSRIPNWFSGYVEKIKRDEAEAKPELILLSDVKKEAKDYSKAAWKDSSTRDRVNNEYFDHQERMYSMIFGR
jgi:hypothetical protein